MPYTAEAWRDRLTGRVAFDPSTAEAAVRRAYRASDLPEPGQVLWVNGPREAAQAIAFVENPPRRLQRTVLAILVTGAAAWVGLAQAIDGSAFAARPWTEVAILSVVLAGFGLAVGVWPRLPAWPDLPAHRSAGKLMLPGAIVLVALAGHLFASFSLGGLPVDPVGRDAALAFAALVGTLPGMFAYLRLQRAYAHLPRSLRELTPSRSVAHRLERAQREAWAPLQRTAVGPRPSELLLEAYRAAHREAFTQRQARRMEPWGLTIAGRVTSSTGPSWMAADELPNQHWEAFWRIPPYLDGFEAVSQAAATSGVDATSSAAAFADLAFLVDRLYPFAAVAVAVQPATTLALDAAGRPHAEDRPTLAWADGTRIYAWHGRLVPPDVLDPNRSITRLRIDHETDPNRRWVLIERYGLGRYLLEAGAIEVQRDEVGRLYRLAQRLGEPILAVRVLNHTPEPDGSFREFWLRVPPTMTTARQAVAWTFDLSTEEYDPVAQS